MTSLENFANAFKVTAASTSTVDMVNAIKAIFDYASVTAGITARWQVQGSNTTDGIILLKCLKANAKVNVSDPSIYPQIVIKAAASNITFGYDPKGQIDHTASSSVWGMSSQSDAFSGFRNISGNAAVMSSYNSTIYVADYEDAISVFVSGLNIFRYGAHVGRIYLPDNKSDVEIGVDGSGVLVGFPTTTVNTTTGHWLTPETTAASVGSVIRVGDTAWSTVLTNDSTATTYTNDVNGKVRLAPYTLRGSSPAAGEVGRTKYMRAYKTALPHLSLLPSNDADSKQAWMGYQNVSGTRQKQLVLWAKSSYVYTVTV